jgi:uroporphyrinogen decarboxylase
LKVHEDGTVEDLCGVPRKKVTVEQDSYRWTYKHVVRSPLESARTAREVEEYQGWPSAEWWDYSTIYEDCCGFSGYVVVNAGDRLDRTAQLKPAMYLRGMEQVYIDLYQNPQIAESIFSRIREYFMEYNRRVFESANGKIDIFMMGDDFGMQDGPITSVETWRTYFKEGFKAYIDLAHKYGIKVMHHTCGSVRILIPEFIDCGLDILQSLQPKAKGIDLGALKRVRQVHLIPWFSWL